MSTSGHGIQENVRANEGTISNQSGDTLLLTDDEAKLVQSYAESLCHETMTPNETTPVSQTDESYLGCGRHVTDFEHTCRQCNRPGHFANECQNIVCFNCDELGHQSRDCGEAVRCCICKSTEHACYYFF